MSKWNDDRDHRDEEGRTPSLVGRLKKLYEDRPILFALGLMAVSALAMIVGFAMLGDSSVIASGPYFQGG